MVFNTTQFKRRRKKEDTIFFSKKLHIRVEARDANHVYELFSFHSHFFLLHIANNSRSRVLQNCRALLLLRKLLTPFSTERTTKKRKKKEK